MKAIAIYTTVPNREVARAIAETLVRRGLVACAQISPIESFYAWNGAVENEPEFRLLLKTTEARYDAVETAIRELHPYELPAIHAVAFERVYAPYAQWVGDNSVGEI